jgi:Cdc6-like AAA superfamily ATPase
MTPIPLFWAEAPTLPPLLYYLAGALLLWAGYLAWLAWQLRQVRRHSDALLQNQLREAEVEAAAGQPDQPSDVDQLQLGVAPVLVALLTHPLTNEPYTIALSGGWGSGKSSVMRQVEKQLHEAKVDFKAVHINVWHFQQEDQLLTEFLRRILEQLTDFRFRWRQILNNLRVLGFGRMLYRTWLLGLAVPVLLLVLWVLLRDTSQYVATYNLLGNWSKYCQQLVSWLRQCGPISWLAELLRAPFYVLRHLRQALPTTAADKTTSEPLTKMLPDMAGLFAIITLAGSVLASLRKLPDLVKPLMQLIPYQQQYEVAQGQVSFRQRYQKDFGTIIRDAAGETLLIFVDDIDRISGPRVLELLETLNFIVTSAQDRRSGGTPGAKLYFVLAMNVPEVVRVLGPALDASKQLDPEPARQLAANYLAKLVDLTVNIPSLQGRDISSLYELQGVSQTQTPKP